MTYDTLEKQIRLLPEDCLDDVSHYIEFILYRLQSHSKKQQDSDLSDYFGIMKNLPDGLLESAKGAAQ